MYEHFNLATKLFRTSCLFNIHIVVLIAQRFVNQIMNHSHFIVLVQKCVIYTVPSLDYTHNAKYGLVKVLSFRFYESAFFIAMMTMPSP